MTGTRLEDNLFVIIGATGDLTSRSLLPALYHLVRDSRARTVVLGAATSDLDDDRFRRHARDALAEAGFDLGTAGAWCDERVHYTTLPRDGSYDGLARRVEELEELHGLGGNRVFYLALPPRVFPMAVEALGAAGLARGPGWTRLVVEKPFGNDSETAADLDDTVLRHFDEQQVYRIDHFLGKETVQNLLTFRFSNPIFEASWNRDRVDRVEITVSEEIDVGRRGAFYDRTGAVRDMIQNHLLQVLCLVAMEAPPTFHPDDIRAEKVKVLKSIVRIDPGDVVLGQYTAAEGVAAYRSLDGVDPASTTETYAAVRLGIDNWRWTGVPFILRTGKAMPERLTEIAVTFRQPPVCLFTSASPDCEVHADVLYLRLAPDEGFELHIEVKEPGRDLALRTVPLRFRYAEAFGEIPDAYETLLRDVIGGDQTRFVRGDWVTESWRLFTPIVDADLATFEYPARSWGPPEALRLLDSPRGWATGG